MTTEVLTPAPAYEVIAGPGTYEIPHPYQSAEDLVVAVRQPNGENVPLILGEHYTVEPEKALAGGGDLTLDPDVAETYAGWTLTIVRRTRAEQGWEGQRGPREKGLERALDRLTQALQDISAVTERAIVLPVGAPGANGDALVEAVLGLWGLVGQSPFNGTTKRGSSVALEGQTVFAVPGRYTPGYIDVYVDGVRLVAGADVDTSDPEAIVLATPATEGQVVAWIAYGTFLSADVLAKSENLGDLYDPAAARRTVGIPEPVASVAQLKAIAAHPGMAARIIDPSRSMLMYWDPDVPVETHQAGGAAQAFIAPDAGAPGAWVDPYADTRMGAWANSAVPARFGRFRGGLKVGDATVDAGATGASSTWLGLVGLGGPGQSWDYMARAKVLSLATNSLIGGTFGARRTGSSAGQAIGLMAVAYGDSAAGDRVWAIYGEAVAGPNHPGGITGVELATANLTSAGAAGDIRPYGTGTRGMTVLNLAAGADANVHGPSGLLSAFVTVRSTGAQAKAGFIFKTNSLSRIGDPNAGYARALMLPQAYGLSWYGSVDQAEVLRLYSAISAAGYAQGMSFSDTGLRLIRGLTEKTMFHVAWVENSVNYVALRPSVSGAAVEAIASGDDTTIDFKVVPKGSGGRFQFGYEAVAAASAGAFSATHYLIVRDGAGTVYRLAASAAAW